MWERRYDDNRIQSRKEMRSVLQYIHGNPVRAEIASCPEDYRWSSIHNYMGNGRFLIGIDTEW
jgi:putative transposase